VAEEPSRAPIRRLTIPSAGSNTAVRTARHKRELQPELQLRQCVPPQGDRQLREEVGLVGEARAGAAVAGRRAGACWCCPALMMAMNGGLG